MKSVRVFDIAGQPVVVSRESAKRIKFTLAEGTDDENDPSRLDFSGARWLRHPSSTKRCWWPSGSRMRGVLGTFSVPFEIKNLNGGEFVGVEALVDTGSSYTVLGEYFLGLLGIRPTERQQFQLGDDSFVEYGMGEARLRLNGSEMTTLVVFGPAGVSPLLGATTLQLFRLSADSVNERLIPMPPIPARPF